MAGFQTRSARNWPWRGPRPWGPQPEYRELLPQPLRHSCASLRGRRRAPIAGDRQQRDPTVLFHVKHSGSFTSEDFRSQANVSRETFDRLVLYEQNLRKWNDKVNLVSRASLEDVWKRHFLDSAQVFCLLGADSGPLLDLGSGAGFPGLVLSIMGIEEVHLVESDQRKAAFLAETATLCGSKAVIHACRIEALEGINPGVITARALAPMGRLVELAFPHFGAKTTGIFLKGQNVWSELTDAYKIWKMSVDRVPSRSDPSGTLVVVREVSRVEPD